MKLFDILPKRVFDEILTRASEEGGLAFALLDPKRRILLTIPSDLNLPPLPPETQEEHVDGIIEGNGLLWAPLFHNGLSVGTLVGTIHKKDGDLLLSKKIFSLTARSLIDLFSFSGDITSLSAEIIRTYEELTLFHELLTHLGAEQNLVKILRIVADTVQQIIPVSHCAILLVDEKEGGVVSHLVRRHDGKELPSFTIPVGQGITGRVISTKQGQIVCNAPAHPHFLPPPYPLTSLLSVPLIVQTKVVGVLNCSDKLSGEEFTSQDLKLLLTIGSAAAVAIENSRLLSEVRDLLFSVVRAFMSAIDVKDDYTGQHSQRVAEYSASIAREHGLSPEEIEEIRLAAAMHDIGKIGTPEEILWKPGPLNESEWHHMREHPLHADRILGQIKQLGKIADLVRHEHERYDGTGYPDKLKGDEIPLGSRIIAIADSYDALTTDRRYRKATTQEQAVEILTRDIGTHFDPEIFKSFLSAYRKGSLTSNPL